MCFFCKRKKVSSSEDGLLPPKPKRLSSQPVPVEASSMVEHTPKAREIEQKILFYNETQQNRHKIAQRIIRSENLWHLKIANPEADGLNLKLAHRSSQVREEPALPEDPPAEKTKKLLEASDEDDELAKEFGLLAKKVSNDAIPNLPSFDNLRSEKPKTPTIQKSSSKLLSELEKINVSPRDPGKIRAGQDLGQSEEDHETGVQRPVAREVCHQRRGEPLKPASDRRG